MKCGVDMYQLGWFSTGRDKAARDLLEAAINRIKSGEIEAEIVFVFSSREPVNQARAIYFSSWPSLIVFP